MTLEEALCWCNQFEDNIILVNPQNSKKTLALQAMKQCKEALEKQIPKKPRLKKFSDTGYIYSQDCPMCKHTLIIGSTHCRDCGQALDWSDTE